MLLLRFFLVALIGTILSLCTGLMTFTPVHALLLLAGNYLAVNVLFVAFWLLVGAFADQTIPISGRSELCIYSNRVLTTFVCNYCNIHTKVIGKEKLPKDGRFLFVSNHRSAFDPLAVGSALSEYEIMFISKPSNMKIFLVGRPAIRAGYLPIDRENARNAIRTIQYAADYMKQDFCSIGIYPEGTRTKTGELLPFHAGSFKIAQKAEAPMVIACTQGGEQAAKNAPFRPTNMTITILEVLSAEQVKAMSSNELAEHTRGVIKAQIDRTEGEKNL